MSAKTGQELLALIAGNPEISRRELALETGVGAAKTGACICSPSIYPGRPRMCRGILGRDMLVSD